MKTLMSLLLVILSMAALPAYANHDGTDGHHCERMSGHSESSLTADADNDGSVDWEEAHDAFIKHFEEMDANQDGVLTPDEIKDCCCMSGNHCKRMEGHKCKDGKCKHDHAAHDKGSKEFEAADKDHDGTLDKKEAKKLKHVYKNFDAIDADKDGTVDRDEVHNFMSGH